MSWGVVAASVITAVVSQTQQRRQQKKVEKAQKKADAVQSRVEAIRARNAKAQQVQEQRIASARAASAGQASGASGSSAVEGIQSSLGTQAGVNAGMINSSLAAASATTHWNRKAGKASRKAADWGELKQLSMSIGQSAYANRPAKPAGGTGGSTGGGT